jgi:hypothetical protein
MTDESIQTQKTRRTAERTSSTFQESLVFL